MPITVGSLGRLSAVTRRGADIVFSFESSDLVLTPLAPNLIRHTWVPTHWRLYAERVTNGYAVRRRFWPAAVSATVAETAQDVIIDTGELQIEATRDPFHLRYRARGGETFLEEAAEGGLSWSYWDYVLRYALAPEDHFYGLGQPDQTGGRSDLDHRGHLREVWNQHSPPASTVFPSLISLRGYGLLIDNPCRAVWDLGHGDPKSFSYRARGGGLQYYVMYGPDFPRLSRTFFDLTGYPPMPPRWTLGLLQSRYGYRNRNELEEIAVEFRRRRLPCDALILDVFWFREMGDLAFDPFQWPRAHEMIARLRERGFRIVTIEEPYLTTRSRNYPEALSNGYLARHSDGSPYTFDFWPGECALVDFSNPAARSWWTEKHRTLFDVGIAGWWADLNEPAKHFQDMAHHEGSAAAVHNSFALHMHQAIHDAHQRFAPDRRIFILSRSAFPGSQRYGAALWSGDVDMTFAALKKQIALGLNVGLAGIPLWGTDVGGFGFAGECTAELYVRWFQFGAFCPLFRPHGEQTQLREPWQFGPEVEDVCRKYLELRYRLLPYIYSALREACSGGLPIMRALAAHFPNDPETYNLADEYLFGASILVAPILSEGATSRSVYLPAGGWIDFWTDELHSGPGRIAVDAALNAIPLFVRQGAIIPTGPAVQYSSERPLDPLTLEIYPGADGAFSLYEDDGETASWQDDEYAETEFRIFESADGLSCSLGEPRGNFAGFRPERTVALNIHRQSRPASVECDGAAVAALPGDPETGARAGWSWNEEKRILSIRLQGSRTARVVRVSPGKSGG